MKRLYSMIFAFTILALFYAGPVSSAIVNVNLSGTIDNVVESGLTLPSGHNIGVNSSTFTVHFSYDTEAEMGDNGSGFQWYMPTGPLTVTIDGTHTFQSPAGRIMIQNSNYDIIDVYDNDNAEFPDGFDVGNYHEIWFHFEDRSGAALSSLELPESFNLDDWGYSRRMKLQAMNYPGDGASWWIAGPITNQVPIPSAVWLLSSGLVGIVGIRKKFKN